MPSEQEQVIPLALSAAVHPSPDQENPSTKPRRHRRRCILCCVSCTAVLILIGIILIILAFTVFKVKEPVLTLNSITMQGLSALATSPTPSTGFNMTVIADISVKNPNAASFKFGSTTTSVYYKDGLVGVAYGPPGNARADRTLRTNMTVDVLGDRLIGDMDLVTEALTGAVAIKSSTMIGGRVKIIGIFKHHVDVMMNCSLNIAVINQSILDQNCVHRVWL
ncbi:uncharacterized protein LOC120259069 [Dioscorea cayenensis subsp. rotundata]|uniref:Uncharacterized protein LOC120259069 n=1 Tax=Dioscorea cayennensis subsp. rotundata TaxID=55577 RepID=A0AB40B5I0_DIOCR|nr:uncharacterized protein LOC120259069 [Dioscorea cayenensis subsp. rotundata]